jgi:hypothetical protein
MGAAGNRRGGAAAIGPIQIHEAGERRTGHSPRMTARSDCDFDSLSRLICSARIRARLPAVQYRR